MTQEKNNEVVKANILARLAEDFKYYAAACLYIINKKAKQIPFVLNKPQKRLEEFISKIEYQNKPVRVIIVKARQIGFSTFVGGRQFWRITTRKNEGALTVAHETESAEGLLRKAKYFLKNLPEAVQPKIKYDRKNELYFEDLDSSWLIGTANNPNLGRSRTFRHVHLSEMAFYKKEAEQAFLSLIQSVPDEPGTSVIIESTANGMDNLFYSEVERALRGESNFQIFFVPWHEEETYQMDYPEDYTFNLDEEEEELVSKFGLNKKQLYWRRYTIHNKCQGSVDLFKQEYPSTLQEAFLYTGHPMFDLNVLTEMRKDCVNPVFVGDVDTVANSITDKGDSFKIYKYPADTSGVCVLGVDIAEGIEAKALDRDYSVIQVVDAASLNTVATYRKRVPVDLFPHVIKYIAKFYNNAHVIPESNKDGLMVINKLRELGYRKIYKERTYDKTYMERTVKYGFNTNQKTKTMLIGHLAELIRERMITLNDVETLKELSKFSRNDKGKMQASVGHDDTVIALALGYWGVKYAPVLRDVTEQKSLEIKTRWTFGDLKKERTGTEESWFDEHITGVEN